MVRLRTTLKGLLYGMAGLAPVCSGKMWCRYGLVRYGYPMHKRI